MFFQYQKDVAREMLTKGYHDAILSMLIVADARHIIHNHIIIRDALLVQVSDEPTLFTIAQGRLIWTTIVTYRFFTSIIYLSTYIPPLFTNTLSHPQHVWRTVQSALFTILIVGFLLFDGLTGIDTRTGTQT